MPSYSEIVSAVALVISLGSLSVSGYVAFRDRPRLKIISRFAAASEYGPNRVVLTFINKGRRPVILRLLGGTSKDGKWAATFLEREKGGLRLGEHERDEHTIEKEDTVSFHPDHEDFFFERLWVEDSLGNRHQVPNSRDHINKLWS
jgi:hypothetical protein